MQKQAKKNLIIIAVVISIVLFFVFPKENQQATAQYERCESIGNFFPSLDLQIIPTNCQSNNRGFSSEGTIILDGKLLSYTLNVYSSPGGSASDYVRVSGDSQTITKLNSALCTYLKKEAENFTTTPSFSAGYLNGYSKCLAGEFMGEMGKKIEININTNYRISGESYGVTAENPE